MFRWMKKNQKPERVVYDPAEKYPAIRCSICTGEQVGGLQRRGNGAFEELMLIRNDRDLQTFCEMMGTTDIPKLF